MASIPIVLIFNLMSPNIKTFFFLIALLFGASYAQALWQGPTQTPPGGNVSTPINIGNNSQIKEGNLTLNASNYFANGLLVPYGNVGIGTASPGQKLEVVGNIKGQIIESASGGVKFPDGTTQITAAVTTNTRTPTIQVFTSSGTWIKPTGVIKIRARIMGGGGGGSNGSAYYSATGGGGGGYAEKLIDVSAVSSVAVTVGAGGGGCTYSGTKCPGGGGGASSFGSYLSASGGAGDNSGAGGAGGSGNGGDINIEGAQGSPNAGGNSHLSPVVVSGISVSGKNYGGGGGPGNINDFPGGTGATGVVIVEEF